MSTVEALDAAFAGESCDVVGADGRSQPLPTDRWTGTASQADMTLFVRRCTGPTLDVGCGPGRLTGALWNRGVDVLGLDISPEAVRQTRERGAPALCRDIFTSLPRPGHWQHILLADGNIGLGGRPDALLRQLTPLLGPHGTLLVELAGSGGLSVHEGVHLRVGGRRSGSFDWATVGIGAITAVAAAAAMLVVDLASIGDRHVATLQHCGRSSGARTSTRSG